MATPDYDVIKEIPGYKVILKSVLKSQIQQLVEQLASTTDEESVILTASVSDGTLSHLGSDSGKGFLEDHEDIKSQFLGFCLKKHHRKKQEEKERQEAEALQQSMQASPQRMGGPRGLYGMRSPRFPSPRGPAHPVSMIRASPGGRMGSPGVRHEPYPLTRPRRSPLNFDPGRGPGSGLGQGPLRKSLDGQIIKIEPDDDNSNQSESDKPGSTNQSPSHTPSTPSNVKSESGSKDTDDDAQSESSNSNIPNEQASETNIGLDSDLSNLISGSNTESAEVDPNVTVKLEALTETEMELEITGVEPGRSLVPQDNWDPNASMGMNFDPTGATGSQGDMSQQGYSQPSDELNEPRLFERHFIEPLPVHPWLKKPFQRKRCTLCSSKGPKKLSDPFYKRKETRYWCPECRKALCVHPCFKLHHTMLETECYRGAIKIENDTVDGDSTV